MSSLKHKWEILVEIIGTKIKQPLKYIIWKKQSKGFRSFGAYAVFEKPLYTRKLQYVSIGERTLIKSGSRIQCDDSYAGGGLYPDVRIGKRCGIGYHFCIFGYDKVYIGDDVSIADNVMITSENHGTDVEDINPFGKQPLITKPVFIGDGVWLSKNVSVMPGCSIGEKSIIGANSVVTHDIPPYSIAVGTPARVIKSWDFELHKWISIT